MASIGTFDQRGALWRRYNIREFHVHVAAIALAV
jgi:hypothetical protein